MSDNEGTDDWADWQYSTQLSLVSRATFLDQVPKQCNRRIGQGEVLNPSTGELRPHMCGANSCPYCSKIKRRQVVRAVGASDPQAFLTLTQVGNEFPVVQARMRNLFRRLARSGWPMEFIYVVECNRKNGKHFHHVHALVHGVVPDASTMADAAQHAGLGAVVQFDELKGDPLRPARYIWQNDSYRRPTYNNGERKPRKHLPLDLPHLLWINGGRIFHSSRGFWRIDGEPTRGGFEALVRMTREKSNRLLAEIRT